MVVLNNTSVIKKEIYILEEEHKFGAKESE